jgi:cellulose biosynthesis protein BcsQ
VTSPETPKDYEQFVAQCFREIGFRVEAPSNPNQEAWDLRIVAPDGRIGAVQIKSRRSGALPQPMFNRLSMYLTGPAGAEFDFGINVVNTSFSSATMTMLENASPEAEEKFVYGAIVRFPIAKINWILHSPSAADPPDAPPPPAPDSKKTPAFRVAVFTEKGGVGKTSVAAHLAGALLHQGHNAVLVDCDVQKNLSLLLGEGVNVRDKRGNVTTLVIEKYESFDDSNYKNFYIIFDCAPNFDKNDPAIFEGVTDTVIPIVLSPLSVLNNGEVIGRTIANIRKINQNMRFHIVINQYEQSKTAANFQIKLIQYIKYWLQHDGLLKDDRVKFYDPDEMSIRRSTIMLHWGAFLLRQGGEPHLAFETRVNGATNLLSDFLSLADSIEERLHDS